MHNPVYYVDMEKMSMKLNQNVFVHETDRAAMEALQAIPGFSQVMKAFLSSWSEKAMYIENMASYVRISEKQFPRYDQMLKDVCAKLGIEKPDLFLKLDVVPNAYTSGETRPFIVITSGLLNIMPEELLPTVLAHECGHIVCHHVLYRTMGTWVLSGALTLVPLGAIAIYPIMSAFHHWMRCSELSADRAAVLCDGSPDHLIEMCMRFAGGDKKIASEMNVEAFMEQAQEYRKLVSDSKYNKTLEFMRFSQATHPINAVRALECYEWTQTENYRHAKEYFRQYQNGAQPDSLPVSWNEKSFNGKDVTAVTKQLEELGFTNVKAVPTTDRNLFDRERSVTSVSVSQPDWKESDWVDRDALIEVKYYNPGTKESSSRAASIRMAHSNSWYAGKTKAEAEEELTAAGFTDISFEPMKDIIDEFDRARNTVFTVSVNGRQVFRRGEVFPKDAKAVITYHEML